MDSNDVAAPPPGWYPDPLDSTLERLWDGERWVEEVRPAATSGPTIVGPGSADPLRPLAPPRPTPRAPAGDDHRSERQGFVSTGSVVGLGLALFALVLIGGCAVVVVALPLAVRGGDGFVEEAEVENAVPAPVPQTTIGPPVEPTTAVAPDTTTPAESEIQLDHGTVGTVPVVLDTGDRSLFEIVVAEPVDVTGENLAADTLGDDSLDGVIHIAVPVTVTLVESSIDPFPVAEGFDWAIVGGATTTTYRPAEPTGDGVGCGAIDDALTAVVELGVGEGRSGRICFVIAADDFDHPDTRVVLRIGVGETFSWRR